MTDLQGKYLSLEEFERFEQQNARSFDELRSSISEINRNVAQLANRPTNFGWVFSGIGVVITIIGMVGGLVAYGLNSRMDDNAKGIEKAESQVAKLVENMDLTLQREMRILDDGLQREMRLIDEPLLVRLSAAEKREEQIWDEINRRGEWMADHDRMSAATNATQTERLDSLEDRIDAIEGGRFTRDDYNEYVLPQIMDLTQRLNDAERTLADRSSTIESVRREQERRRPLVYEE